MGEVIVGVGLVGWAGSRGGAAGLGGVGGGGEGGGDGGGDGGGGGGGSGGWRCGWMDEVGEGASTRELGEGGVEGMLERCGGGMGGELAHGGLVEGGWWLHQERVPVEDAFDAVELALDEPGSVKVAAVAACEACAGGGEVAVKRAACSTHHGVDLDQGGAGGVTAEGDEAIEVGNVGSGVGGTAKANALLPG